MDWEEIAEYLRRRGRNCMITAGVMGVIFLLIVIYCYSI